MNLTAYAGLKLYQRTRDNKICIPDGFHFVDVIELNAVVQTGVDTVQHLNNLAKDKYNSIANVL